MKAMGFMVSNTQKLVQQQYAISGEEYDAIRLKDPRGALLSAFDVELVHQLARTISRDAKVLEAGAGTGRFTIPMIRSGFRVTATDINESLLATLRERLVSEGLADACVVQDESIFELSFPDESFDFAYSIHVIPRFLCLEDQEKALIELARVLKPGGRLLFNFWNRSSLLGAMTKKYAARAAEMDRAIQKAQMKVIDRRGKWLLSRGVLRKLPLAGGRALALCEKPLSRFLPRRAWDVFTLAEKQR